ncbi:hypothetical protein KKG71_03000 [Patescibacteria group bacterium]|nr:hypothetical protein [Patescibacteria group bacterium]
MIEYFNITYTRSNLDKTVQQAVIDQSINGVNLTPSEWMAYIDTISAEYPKLVQAMMQPIPNDRQSFDAIIKNLPPNHFLPLFIAEVTEKPINMISDSEASFFSNFFRNGRAITFQVLQILAILKKITSEQGRSRDLISEFESTFLKGINICYIDQDFLEKLSIETKKLVLVNNSLLRYLYSFLNIQNNFRNIKKMIVWSKISLGIFFEEEENIVERARANIKNQKTHDTTNEESISVLARLAKVKQNIRSFMNNSR